MNTPSSRDHPRPARESPHGTGNAVAPPGSPTQGGPPTTPSLVMNIDELGQLLRVSVRTIWRKVSTGELPAPIAIGRSKRWSRAAISEWVKRQSDRASGGSR